MLSCPASLCKNSCSAKRASCCMIVQMSSAKRHDKAVESSSGSVRPESNTEATKAWEQYCSCCARRRQTKERRGLPHGEEAHLGPVCACNDGVCPTAPTSLSGVNPGPDCAGQATESGWCAPEQVSQVPLIPEAREPGQPQQGGRERSEYGLEELENP